ncbi:MAG TPA: hypothetical protein V6D47_01705 [Oscillatoriaceae cyanobacterium]
MPERRENERVSPRILGWSVLAVVVVLGILVFGSRVFLTPRSQLPAHQKLAQMPAHTRLYDPAQPAKQVMAQAGAGSAIAYVPSGPAVKLTGKKLVVVGQTSEGYVIVHQANEKAMAPPNYPVGGGGGQAMAPGLPPGTLFLEATNGRFQPIVKATPTKGGR